MASFVVGIMGKKRSGKDTFAERLINEHGFTQVRFADPLRAMLKALDPIVEAGSYSHPSLGMSMPWSAHLTEILGSDDDWETAKELPEVRRLMQRIGTEAGRGVLGEDVWVDAARRKIVGTEGPVVVTDVRFPNEFDMIEERKDGWTVRITRPSLGYSDDLHDSETALDNHYPRYEITNDGTIADLHSAADLLMRDYRTYEAAGVLQYAVI